MMVLNKSGQVTAHSFYGKLIFDFIRELNLLRRPHRLGSDFTFEDQLSFILLAKLAVYSADLLRSTRVIFISERRTPLSNLHLFKSSAELIEGVSSPHSYLWIYCRLSPPEDPLLGIP